MTAGAWPSRLELCCCDIQHRNHLHLFILLVKFLTLPIASEDSLLLP